MLTEGLWNFREKRKRKNNMARIGVIGGSGLYNLEGVNILKQEGIRTPYGEPSDKLVLCELEGKEIVFLPRHGAHHTINPSNINYRANIYAMKKMGVSKIVSVSACGSLKEELRPLDFVIPDQFIDRTNQARKYTFFDQGVVVHVSFARPICSDMASILEQAAKPTNVKVHSKGTYLNMEGPQFSTLAESRLYQSWGADIIGMTNLAEARLAREAEICYVSLAAITDYDCWHPNQESVTAEEVIANLIKNAKKSKEILKNFLINLDAGKACPCQEALKYSIVTNRKFIPKKIKKKLDIIIGKYIK